MFSPQLYLTLSLLCCSVSAIWPDPQEYTSGNNVLWLNPKVTVAYNRLNVSEASSPQTFGDRIDVMEAVNRTLETILKQSIVPWKFHPRNELENFEPNLDASRAYIKHLDIIQTGQTNSSVKGPNEVDESYKISIAEDGQSEISAATNHGILRALETMTQLFYKHSSDKGVYTNQAPIMIVDAPKFTHRGLNMDVARNWFPVRDILRTIDALSMNKFNRLHIHMTDSQSWPIEIPSMPFLTKNGAYAPGLSYSPENIANIHKYGLQRGVEVILEFDMPGHTASIAYAYPNLIAGFRAVPWSTYCAEPPCGSLKLNSKPVDEFISKLMADVLPRISPHASYFHTGGDEVNKQVYLLDETVGSNETSVIQPFLQKFVDRVHNQVLAAGLTPIVWEEMALDWNLTLHSDVVVQTWLSDKSTSAVTAKGHKVITGNYDLWYLDCGKGQWLDFDNGASYQRYYPFKDYCDPVKNWRLVYSFNPLSGVPKEQQHLVLGGEVHIWSEQTDPVNLDDMVWPRASAAGEVLWSGREDCNGQNRSQITASPRLSEMRERMVLRGISPGPVQMVYCTQMGGTECSL
ncbi:unnamed protein product [Blumeria hordei]|uniref:Beta-hexosaminidase n=1 Tax=Blumeria hordei TaxID=2867405 RepID=A0A383UVI9_BLUHO|nr:unnamed protein product [Blumeria hordei]